MSTVEKKFLVTIEGQHESFEVPIWAHSLDEASELAEAEYGEAGFVIDRVRPEVKL